MSVPDCTAVLVSCDPESEGYALTELREAVSDLPEPEWLTGGLARFSGVPNFGLFSERVREAAPIFVRHLAPVSACVPLAGTPGDLAALAEAALTLAPRLDPARTFAAQSRLVGDGPRPSHTAIGGSTVRHPYRRFEVNRTLSDALIARTGAELDTRLPEQIVSVACAGGEGLLGVSLPAQNLSLWPGGERRFQREAGQISRAEFKLLEALEVFGLELPPGGSALDLGAAPGGWTRVLREKGLRVVAVDPADLDPRLAGDRGVQHVRKLAGAYLPARERFDLVANDIRADPDVSVALTRRARASLRPGALAIQTLKFPHAADALRLARLALAELARDYEVLGARQLFHNRSEVTAALRAR